MQAVQQRIKIHTSKAKELRSLPLPPGKGWVARLTNIGVGRRAQ